MRRPLPTPEEALRILTAKRTRPQRRPPPPVGRKLMGYLKEMDGKFGQGANALISRWREVVGPEIARRTEPVKLTRGRNGGPSSLEIRVAGPSAAIIQHQAHEILARVNLFLGADAVQKLRIVQGPLQRMEPAPTPKRRAMPLDAAAEAELSRALANAPEGRLKESLAALGRAVLRRSTSR
ncbi:MAG TPA: DciA family protein [Phenylobacterium sp.]|nr:DciA family protein [Phenylobacterium sp.]